MSLFSHLRPENKRAFPVASEGLPLIVSSAFATVYLAALGLSMVALFFGAVTCFIVFFFRDPDRVIPTEDGAVVSPADGKVVEVRVVSESDVAREKMLKVSVFMSVFNVHVNRIPTDGTVVDISYYPGRFFSANLDKASKDNERNAVSLDIGSGRRLVVVQVAGLIARRIVCRIHKGDHLRRGQRFGMICFGSRLDVYLPSDTKPAVSVGDRILAGTSILGHLT
jgi:phosphatidylserine decarboxylase